MTTAHSTAHFNHGSEWLRTDFHLHTIQESGPSRKAYRAEFRDCEETFDEAFISQLKQEAISIGMITNHNKFDLDEFSKLSERAEQENILLLPGVELGIRGGGSSIHTLVVFDPKGLSSENNFIATFLAGQFPRGSVDEGSATEDDLTGCLKRLEGLGIDYFIVFAHVDSSNGLLNVMKKTELGPIFQQTKDIWERRVLGFQGIKIKGDIDSHREWLAQKLPEGMPIPAFVAGSDPETSLAEVGRKDRGTCYLKLSTFSYHSVKFALRDKELRVRTDPPEQPKRPTIRTLEIEGGKHGYSAYRLSSELNTLIGSRGSGKSVMIETLRWGLGLGTGDGDKAYKKELIHEFLDRGAKVKISGQNEYGDLITVSRAYTEKTNPAPPQVFVNEKLSQLSVERVFPGLLYFGQKDLGERGDSQSGFYSQFFNQILGGTPAELAAAEKTHLDAFIVQIGNYQAAIKAKSDDDEYKYEQDALKKKLDVFKEHGIEERLKQITAFDQDVRRFEKFKKEFPAKALKLKEASAELADHLNENQAIFTSEINEEFLSDLSGIQEEYRAQLDVIEGGIEGFRSLNRTLQALHERVDAKRKILQDQFAQILREIDLPELNVDEYRKMVSRHQQLSEIRRLTAERGGKLAQFERELVNAGEKWLNARKAITNHFQDIIQQVNENLPANIRISISFQGDREDFRQFLKELFYGSRFDNNSLNALVDACDNGLELFKRRAQIKDTELSTRMAEIFQEKLSERFKDILSFSPKDARLIHYDAVPINELSLGKRAMALLLLLLSLEKHPIIILDQPEDDLDNETIHRLVVRPLLVRKEAIQFIIATHNPNIPVLGDAEQVIACYETKRREFEQHAGSLDNPKIKDAIVNIMEGGQKAFDQRHDIYTLWKKSS